MVEPFIYIYLKYLVFYEYFLKRQVEVIIVMIYD